MALPIADELLLERDPMDRTALAGAKRRRASRLSAALPPERADAGDDPDSESRGRVSYKLTKAQRATLIRIIALHHYVDTVREILAEEQPDFPAISDNLIRYYRQQIEAEVYAEAAVVRAQALRSGLANKAVRVRYMIRMVEQWRRVPLVEQATYFDDAGLATTSYKTRVEASREQRELLKQIAMELGQLSMPAGPAGPAGTDPLDDEDAALDADLRSDLNELLAEMAERDRATELALQAAVRPEREGTPP